MSRDKALNGRSPRGAVCLGRIQGDHYGVCTITGIELWRDALRFREGQPAARNHYA